jgi:hypothetical protein
MGADKAGARSAASAVLGQAKLKLPRASVVRDVWDRLLDFAVATKLRVLDQLMPLQETPVDRAIREEGSSCGGRSRGSTSGGGDDCAARAPQTALRRVSSE